jgi:hypothetical protein
VVIRDLDVRGSRRRPYEADAVLIIDADAVLPGAIAFQRFQAIAGRNAQIIDSSGPMAMMGEVISGRLRM